MSRLHEAGVLVRVPVHDVELEGRAQCNSAPCSIHPQTRAPGSRVQRPACTAMHGPAATSRALGGPRESCHTPRAPAIPATVPSDLGPRAPAPGTAGHSRGSGPAGAGCRSRLGAGASVGPRGDPAADGAADGAVAPGRSQRLTPAPRPFHGERGFSVRVTVFAVSTHLSASRPSPGPAWGAGVNWAERLGWRQRVGGGSVC